MLYYTDMLRIVIEGWKCEGPAVYMCGDRACKHHLIERLAGVLLELEKV